ncbi:hypothetical protein B0A54_00952 [Friedmanniomyces endolithicus]|uniref:Uncharacterized protein n=1 Tax=Friedmanniomyces endolithicus TaxID=329885 RepID=A0A4U0VKC5_9PEZI|nr:hypothetical protein B0A54_00952 [Friedmanniomyces endolithicus]
MPPSHRLRYRTHGSDTDNPTFSSPSYPHPGPGPADSEPGDLTPSIIATGELDTLWPTWPCAGTQTPSEDSDSHKEPCTGRESVMTDELLRCGGVVEGKLSSR